MVEDRDDPEHLRSFPAIFLLMEWIDEASDEVASRAWNKYGHDSYPALAVSQIQARAHAQEFPEKLADFEKTEKELDNLYGNAIQKKYDMTNTEAESRLRNTLSLVRNIGALRIDTINAYYAFKAPDNIDFTGWSDD